MSAIDAQLRLFQSFSCHVATEESTAAPGEEITAVPPGKTTNNTEKEKKKLLNSNYLSLNFLLSLLLYFLFAMKSSVRLQ